MSSSLVTAYLDEVEEGHLGLAATEAVLPKFALDVENQLSIRGACVIDCCEHKGKTF